MLRYLDPKIPKFALAVLTVVLPKPPWLIGNGTPKIKPFEKFLIPLIVCADDISTLDVLLGVKLFWTSQIHPAALIAINVTVWFLELKT